MRVSLVVAGAVAGIIAGMVMAMYAMIASATFLGQGFFTPLYGIASPLVGSEAMMTSLKQGFYFDLGPALVGLVVHKRHGKGQAADQWVTMTLADFVALTTGVRP